MRNTSKCVYVFTLVGLYPAFCSNDCDLDSITLIFELNLDIAKMYQK